MVADLNGRLERGPVVTHVLGGPSGISGTLAQRLCQSIGGRGDDPYGRARRHLYDWPLREISCCVRCHRGSKVPFLDGPGKAVAEEAELDCVPGWLPRLTVILHFVRRLFCDVLLRRAR